jgi:hypothetical protein
LFIPLQPRIHLHSATTCLPLSNGSFLDFKTEPTHCKHIRTAKHKIDQISSPAPAAFRPVGGLEDAQNTNGRRPAAASATGLVCNSDEADGQAGAAVLTAVPALATGAS